MAQMKLGANHTRHWGATLNRSLCGRLAVGAFWSPIRVGFASAVVALLVVAVVLAGSPAHAQTCPGGDDWPTAVDVSVTAVPIVVTSTTADYFVLYASLDVEGGTVDYVVQVILGEDGTTTLSENVVALPMDRYRVEKYLVSDPADVDGDCIDDITELGDPVGLNPMNPGMAVEIADGALSIPDLATFEKLGTPGLAGGMSRIKFSIFEIETDRPSVYFQDTKKYDRHVYFADGIGLDEEPDFIGTMGYDTNLVAPDGSRGVYLYTVSAVSIERSIVPRYLERVYTLMGASMPVVDNDLAHWRMGRTSDSTEGDPLIYETARIEFLFDDDVLGQTHFTVLNPGEGYGLLRNMEPGERPHPRDVVIYDALPNELPRVAGIVTTLPQTPLSHINLRAIQDGVPNAYIAGALDDNAFSSLIGSHVYYSVTETGYSIRAASSAEVDKHYAAYRPAQVQVPERDLTVTSITGLNEIGFDDWNSFGVKAANVAVLGTLGFPEGTVPDGFAVPFYYYDEFMKHNGLYDDVREMLADPDFQTDYDVKEDELKKLRKKIKKAETPEWMNTDLTAMHASFPEGTSLRYRSSTNNEDLPGFSGAGLYDSKTQHAEETVEDGISKSLKQVYASLWNFRAFVERDFYRVDHMSTAMGVLVHRNYSDEQVNGVAVSVDPAYETEGTYYVNSQVDEDLVTNPEANSVPEEVLLNSDGTYRVVALSNRAEAGQTLMTDDQLAQLSRHLGVIHRKFAELYGIEPGGEFAMEIEFKITSDGILAIKQARPWVFPLLAGRFDLVPATHNGSTFIVWFEFSEVVSIGSADFVENALVVEGGIVTNVQQFGSRQNWYSFDVTPDPLVHFNEDVTIFLAGNRPCTEVGAICNADGRRLSNTLGHTVVGKSAPKGTALWSGIMDLEWSEVPGADSYEVQFFDRTEWVDLPGNGISLVFYGAGAVLKDLPITGYFFSSPTKRYTFRVRAVTSLGPTAWVKSMEAPSTGGSESWAATPEPVNFDAMGAPSISGTAQVGETLQSDVLGISDQNGINRVKFHYQWVRSGGTDDSDIEGATGSSYTLTAEDLGAAVKVRVSFVDRYGYSEVLSSTATGAVEPPVQVAMWESELIPGQEADMSPMSSGYSVFGNLDGSLAPDSWTDDGTTYRVQFLIHASESLWLAIDGELPTDFTLTVGDSAYLGSESMVPAGIDEAGVYWWPLENADWSVDESIQVSLAVHPAVLLGSRLKAPVTGYFLNAPAEHDGNEDFSFRIYFSEGVITTADAVRDHVLAVTGGSVSAVKAVGAEGRIWVVSVKPDSLHAVTVDIAADLDCAVAAAVCAADGRRLFNDMKLIVPASQLTVDEPVTDPVEGTPPSEPPAAPVNLTAVVNGDGSVTLSWHAPEDDNLIGYRILRRLPAEGEGTLLVYVSDTGTTATTYTDTDVTSGTQHVYRVKAINGAGVGERSNYVNVNP